MPPGPPLLRFLLPNTGKGLPPSPFVSVVESPPHLNLLRKAVELAPSPTRIPSRTQRFGSHRPFCVSSHLHSHQLRLPTCPFFKTSNFIDVEIPQVHAHPELPPSLCLPQFLDFEWGIDLSFFFAHLDLIQPFQSVPSLLRRRMAWVFASKGFLQTM